MNWSAWSPGDLVAVAFQLVAQLRPYTDAVRAVEPSFDLTDLSRILKILQQAGLPVSVDPPDRIHLRDEHAIALRSGIERAISAVRRLPLEPDYHWLTVWMDSDPPRIWRGLPQETDIELLDWTDTDPESEEWTDRSRIASYTSLRLLRLYGTPVGEEGLGFNLGGLPRLRVLDLASTGIEELPVEVLALDRLECLDLMDNPLRSVSALLDPGRLPALRVLLLKQCEALSDTEIGRLSRTRPACQIAFDS